MGTTQFLHITTNSQSKGITIHKQGLGTDDAYQYTPLIYENQATGVLQVDHLVDPLYDATSWKKFWKDNNYGAATDLALNLPWRWTSPDGVTWTFDPKGNNFHMMKGIFFLDSDGKPFGYAIEQSDEQVTHEKAVTVKARVYNYSFVEPRG